MYMYVYTFLGDAGQQQQGIHNISAINQCRQSIRDLF